MPAVLYDGNNNFKRVDDKRELIEFMQSNQDGLHPIYWREYPGEWLRFHADNPEVYEHLHRMAIDLLALGRRKWGINSLIEVVRWQIAMNTTDPVFKINNNHAPYYARYLMDMEPRLRDFFNIRKVK